MAMSEISRALLVAPAAPFLLFAAPTFAWKTPPLALASSRSTPHPSPPSDHPDLPSSALLDWCLGPDLESENGGTGRKVEIGPSGAGGGSGLFLKEDTRGGEVIFVVPRRKAITLDDALDDPDFGHIFAALVDSGGLAGRKAALAGFMAKEWLKVRCSISDISGKEETRRCSPWEEYLLTLPSWVDRQEHPLWWSDKDVEEFLGDSFGYDEVVGMRSGVEYAAEILQDVIAETMQEQTDMTIYEDEVYDAIRAAFVAILSRAFEDEGSDCCKLVPVLDMTQHSESKGRDDTCVNIDHETNLSGDIIVTALHDLEAGQELWNEYHNKLKPYQFFSFYGFIPGEITPVKDLLKSKSPIFFPAL